MSEIEAAPAPRAWRSPALVGGLAFAGGVALTAGALVLTKTLTPPPPPTPVVVQPPAQPAAAPALPPGTDLATLSAREQVLAGRLDQLELRIRGIDTSARNAASYATRAEKMMVVAGVRRALETGKPLAPLAGQLRGVFPEQRAAIDALLSEARAPITLEDLRQELDSMGPRALAGREGIWSGAKRLLGDLIVLRRADTPSQRPADRLRRARVALDKGDVESARREVSYMPGRDEAAAWLASAGRYVAARDALASIEAAALQAPLTQLPPSAATPAG